MIYLDAINYKKARLWILYRLAEGAFWCLYLMATTLPPHSFRRIAAPMLRLLIASVVPKRRIIKNLSLAFGETYSLASKKGIARGVRQHFVSNLIDCFVQLRFPEYARQTVTITGKENLEAALAKGKGIIALGAHIGNFVLVGTCLCNEALPFHALFRMPKDKRIRSLIEKTGAELRQRIIASVPKRAAVATILRTLRQNGIVFILADNLRSGKVQTRLFGQRVRTSRGPVSLAFRSGASLLPVYLVRSYTGQLSLVIEPEISLVRRDHLATDIVQNTSHVAERLEKIIRCYPDQWNWLTVRMRGADESTAPNHLPQDVPQNLGFPAAEKPY